jgi:hypothetical protein
MMKMFRNAIAPHRSRECNPGEDRSPPATSMRCRLLRRYFDVWRDGGGNRPSLRDIFPSNVVPAIRVVPGLALSVAIEARALGAEPAKPAFFTTYQLMSMCIVDDTKKRAECIAYLAGVVDALRAADSADDPNGPPRPAPFCLPTGMTEDDVRKILTQFLKADPQWYDNPPVAPITVAVQKAFPCPGATP